MEANANVFYVLNEKVRQMSHAFRRSTLKSFALISSFTFVLHVWHIHEFHQSSRYIGYIFIAGLKNCKLDFN